MIIVAQASDGDRKKEVGLRAITSKEERDAGTSGTWQTDVEMFRHVGFSYLFHLCAWA